MCEERFLTSRCRSRYRKASDRADAFTCFSTQIPPYSADLDIIRIAKLALINLIVCVCLKMSSVKYFFLLCFQFCEMLYLLQRLKLGYIQTFDFKHRKKVSDLMLRMSVIAYFFSLIKWIILRLNRNSTHKKGSLMSRFKQGVLFFLIFLLISKLILKSGSMESNSR